MSGANDDGAHDAPVEANYDHTPDLARATAMCEPKEKDPLRLALRAASIARRWQLSNQAIIEGIRRGEHPPVSRLADILRTSAALPTDVRDYIAGRMDKSIKVGKRPTPKFDPEYLTAAAMNKLAGQLVRDRHQANRAAGMASGKGRDPYEAALATVSKWTGMPRDTLDKHARPRKR